MATTNRRNTGGSKPAGSAQDGIEVAAKRGTFYRAGLMFGHEPRQVALDALSEEQYESIVNEPMLIVREIKIEPVEAAKTD